MGDQNGRPENDPRGYVLAKSVPVKEKGRKRQKKIDSDTERAHDCPKRHANYGPSLPVSIPTFGKSLAQFDFAQIAQIQSLHRFPHRRLERCLAAQGGHIML